MSLYKKFTQKVMFLHVLTTSFSYNTCWWVLRYLSLTIVVLNLQHGLLWIP